MRWSPALLVEASAHGGGQGVEAAPDIGLQAHRDVVVGVHLGREPMDVDDLLVAHRVDPDRVELLELVAHGDDHIGAGRIRS